jgi:molybdate transport system substrate-binding protein
MTKVLRISGGGAAKALVESLADWLRASHDATIEGEFSAVGVIRDKFLKDRNADVLILSDALIRELAASGDVAPDSITPVGGVRTGVAVLNNARAPSVRTADELAASLRAASAIYAPDLRKSTAGAHVQAMLVRMGIDREVTPKVREFPNGETAMRQMVVDGDPSALGCTQLTEIRMTAGLAYVGPLPPPFDLMTTYTAAASAQSGAPDLARAFIARLSGPAMADQRAACGFE